MGRKFAVLALFYFVFEGNFRAQAPQTAYLRRGDVTEGFFCVTSLEGLIQGDPKFRNFAVT